jgi:hypothetical protein
MTVVNQVLRINLAINFRFFVYVAQSKNAVYSFLEILFGMFIQGSRSGHVVEWM